MKSLKILLMAVLTILSVSVFAQAKTKNEAKVSNQKSEKMKFTCPMYPDMVMGKLSMCPKSGTTLNLSPKGKMKMEVMKIYTSPMDYEVTNDMPCNLSKNGTVLDLSPKEKMKMEAMKINANRMFPDVTSGKQCRYSGCRSSLNLSPKEIMKIEVMKI